MDLLDAKTLLAGPILKTDNPDCDFPYGLQFLQFLRKEFGTYFNIGTTGYPIGHPSAADPVKDIDYLKEKVDAGADFIMCQGVFDLQTFKDFYKRCREQEINVPILPGVYAINSYQVLHNLKNFCKIMPEEYVKTMEKLQSDADAITDYSIDYVSDLIRSLLKDDEISIPGVHVYCYNNLTLVSKIFEKLDFEDLKIYQPEK
ncbi:methylenetetrahydrofolate reductase [Holotrichia oblita]|uniref:Methylenetetrahydrofolate reductase n=1 Tax=Holotrichia oblita TaxID=644536 RepID=A0ACB9TE89_HOLOL|nr:methylenetetrahydrofolate reductase [Holotrichia oblita]